MLQALVINEKARTVYQLLLAGPCVDVGELPSRTGLTEQQVHTALEVLAALDLARPCGNVPGGWEAISPGVGLAAIMQRQEELAQRQRHVDVAKTAAAAYAVAHSTPGHLERLGDLQSTQVLAGNLVRSSMTELQVTFPAPIIAGELPVPDDWHACHADGGTRLRALYHDSVRDDPAAMLQAAQLASSGAQVRMASDLPPTLIISDKHAALILLEPARPHNGAICVREPIIVTIFATIFNNTWKRSMPLEGAAPPAFALGISANERALLTLLGTGLTDEAVARRLGTSVRTTRRQVATLMAKLGASSRFQAGRKAAERGWFQA